MVLPKADSVKNRIEGHSRVWVLAALFPLFRSQMGLLGVFGVQFVGGIAILGGGKGLLTFWFESIDDTFALSREIGWGIGLFPGRVNQALTARGFGSGKVSHWRVLLKCGQFPVKIEEMGFENNIYNYKYSLSNHRLKYPLLSLQKQRYIFNV